LFDYDAFEEWLAVSSLVLVVSYHCVPGGFSQSTLVSIRWGVTGLEVLDVWGCQIVSLVLG